MHPDQKYIHALVNNDEDLIEELYEKCFPLIKSMIIQYGGNDATAADIFQDALVDLFKKVKARQFILSFPVCAYIRGICKNKWCDERKKEKAEGVTFVDFEVHNNKGEDFYVIMEECKLSEARLDMMRQKFKELGQSCKELLQLSWTKNDSGKKLSNDEIARMLHTSDVYVRKKKSECIARLTKLIVGDSAFKNLKR